MFNSGGLSFITDFVNNNIVNVIYRNNDILNLLTDLFIDVGNKFGIDTANGLSSVFLKLYFGTIILYLIVHAIADGKRLYNKFFNTFTNNQKLTPKVFFGSEIIQMFLLTIMATILLMPAKMQYVKLQPYNPSGTTLPQYIDLDDTHPKGEVIDTIAILAWSVWAHNRFVYGIQTSSGPVPANTEIAVFSMNRLMPSIFHEYFTEINTAIDGYVYVYNYINALKEINELEKEEFSKYANILDSQLSLSLGMKTVFRADDKILQGFVNEEYKPIFDPSSTGDFAENRELNALIANVEGHGVLDSFNNWEDGSWGDRLSMVSVFVGRLITSTIVNMADTVNAVSGASAEALVNRQLAKFDAIDENGLALFESHVSFLEEGHKNNTTYKTIVNDYIKHTITGENPIPNDPAQPDNCTDATNCMYITKLQQANKYLLKDTFSRLINLTGISPKYSGTFPITPAIDVGATTASSSPMDFGTYSKIYFAQTLAKNQARLLEKIDKLKTEEYPFKRGIRSIFLLSHTNFLVDMSAKHASVSPGYAFSNLGGGESYNPSNQTATNTYYATSLLKHSLLTRDSTSDNANESMLSFVGAYNANPAVNEVKDVKEYSVNDGLNLKAFLNPKIDNIVELKKALDENSNQVQDTYKQVDNSYYFAGYETNDRITIDFSNIVSGGTIQGGAYNLRDSRLLSIFGDSLQYVTDVYTKFNPIANFTQVITEQMLYEYLFTMKGKLYNNLLNYKSGELNQEKLQSYGLTFTCATVSTSDSCDYLTTPNIANFTSPIGTKAYLKYNGSKIEMEIQKSEYILNAIQSIPIESRTNEEIVRIALDVKLIKKYLNILKHFASNGDTNKLTVRNNDEVFELFKFVNYLGFYITQITTMANPVEVKISSVPMSLVHNLYFYPHAIAFFENGKSTNTEVDAASITSTIGNLYDFISPATSEQFTNVFGKFEYNPTTFEIKLVPEIGFLTDGTPTSINSNINKAQTNFYSNLELMTELQNGDLKMESTESPNIDNGTLTDASISAFVATASKVSLPKTASIAAGSTLVALLSDELAELLFWVTSNFADMFAEKVIKYVIEPYHFIFGKNDFTELGSSTLSASAIKGVFETSNNFHMENIKLNFAVPPQSPLEKIVSEAQKHEELIGDVGLTALGIAANMMTGGVAGAAIFAIAKTVSVGVVKGVAKGALKGTKKLAKKLFKRGKNKTAQFRKKNGFGKAWAVVSFLSSAPFQIISAILGALMKTFFMFIVVLAALAGIYAFLIQFILRIAMPLAVGLMAIVLQALFYPVIYMFKDAVNGFSGSFEDMNSNYLEGLTSTFKTLYKSYLSYILIVMIFVAVYKIIMGITVYVSTNLMFQWHTFNLPVSMIVLLAFWISTHIMAKIILFLIPESQLAKFNFHNK